MVSSTNKDDMPQPGQQQLGGRPKRGNKATNKRQQQHKLKSGSRGRHSHYKLLTQKQQLGGVISNANRVPIKRAAQGKTGLPRVTDVLANHGNWSKTQNNADYPMVEYPPTHSAPTTPKSQTSPKKKQFTEQSTNPVADSEGDKSIKEENIYGTLGAPLATPRYQRSPPHDVSARRSSVKHQSSPRSTVTLPRHHTAMKPSMQLMGQSGKQPEYKVSGLGNWGVPSSLNEKYDQIPMDDDDEGTLQNRVNINSVRKPLNRYPGQILPYVNNTLQVEGVDYINASPITLKVDGKPQLSYIATQCPTVASFPNFWKMILQYKVPVICMVTNLVENSREKCNQYYPDADKQVTHGEITITCISKNHMSDAITELIFTVEKDGQKHKVIHLHYTVWPDLDYPSIDKDRAQLITLSNEISKACNGGTAPPVIHCSAGVGRTGSIIAINYLMHIPKEIRDTGLKNDDKLNLLLLIITQLRKQRLWMVQKTAQFEGIIQTVLNTNGVDDRLWNVTYSPH